MLQEESDCAGVNTPDFSRAESEHRREMGCDSQHCYKVPEADNFVTKAGFPLGVVGYIWNPSARRLKQEKGRDGSRRRIGEKNEKSLINSQFVLLKVGP